MMPAENSDAPSVEASFIGALAATIDPAEFDLLRAEAGFVLPNDFDFGLMREPLERRRFPRSNHYEYLWAIYECGLDCLTKYSAPMRQYIAAVYVSCNKAHVWGATVQGDYYYTLVEATMSNIATAPHALWYTKLLSDNEAADAGYDPRFANLASAVLQTVLARPVPDAWVRLSRMLASRSSADFLAELRVCSHGVDDWRKLYEHACAVGGFPNNDFGEILLGR